MSTRHLCQGEEREHRDSVYCEYYNTHVLYEGKRVYATMLRTRDEKLVVYHGLETGEFYDLKADPDEFTNLWDDPKVQERKFRLLKQCFDRSVFTMDPLPERITTW